MTSRARIEDRLGRLCFGDLVAIDAADGFTTGAYLEYAARRLLLAHVKDSPQDLRDELHRRKVVATHENAVTRWLLWANFALRICLVAIAVPGIQPVFFTHLVCFGFRCLSAGERRLTTLTDDMGLERRLSFSPFVPAADELKAAPCFASKAQSGCARSSVVDLDHISRIKFEQDAMAVFWLSTAGMPLVRAWLRALCVPTCQRSKWTQSWLTLTWFTIS